MRAFLLLLAVLATAACAAEPDPKTPLRLTLTDSPLTVTFTNISTEPVRILRPLDGSERCWLMPYYRLSVKGSNGTEVPFAGRCGEHGLWADTKWPDDYIITLPPGSTHKQRLAIVHTITWDDDYILTFQYQNRPELMSSELLKRGEFHQKLKEAIEARQVWQGEVTSNQIRKRMRPPSDEGPGYDP